MLSFVQDGTRNEKIKSDREKYSNQLKELLKGAKMRFYSIKGDYLERFSNKSKKLIEEVFGLKTIW